MRKQKPFKTLMMLLRNRIRVRATSNAVNDALMFDFTSHNGAKSGPEWLPNGIQRALDGPVDEDGDSKLEKEAAESTSRATTRLKLVRCGASRERKTGSGLTAARRCPGNCGFAVTWHPKFCCKACGKNPGTHGAKCERRPCRKRPNSGASDNPADPQAGSRPADVRWGLGIQIPTAQWKPVSHDSFKARAVELMKDWRENHYQQQGMTHDYQNNTTFRPNFLYEIDFDGRKTPPKYDFRHAKVTYGIIASGLNDDQFQDGSYAGDAGTTTLYHATHDAYVARICREGFKSSPLSHGVTGLWARDIEEPDKAFSWGATVLDKTHGCYSRRLRHSAAPFLQSNGKSSFVATKEHLPLPFEEGKLRYEDAQSPRGPKNRSSRI